MFDYRDSHFEEVCRGALGREIDTVEERRRAAMGKFRTRLAVGLLLGLAGVWAAAEAGWSEIALLLPLLLLVGTVVVALMPLGAVGESLKNPVLEALARQGGMDYLPDGFDPPVYPDARPALFGGWLSSQSFTDLFHGTDSDGRRFAVYEAKLQRGSGKHTHTVFSGQVYAFQRTSGGAATSVIVPDRGVFNLFKPMRGMERARIDGDEAFEKKFEVYSTDPEEARRLLIHNGRLRRHLLELRAKGRVFAYIGPEDALVAVGGPDRFEPGSMFRSRHGRERARAMFDDLRAAMAELRILKEGLG